MEHSPKDLVHRSDAARPQDPSNPQGIQGDRDPGSTKIRFFVVVCTEFHSAHGPYVDADQALQVARRMTLETPCTYVPVLFVPDADNVEVSRIDITDDGPETTTRRRRDHGYL